MEAERIRAETEKLEAEAAKRIAGARGFDDDAMRAGTKAAGATDPEPPALRRVASGAGVAAIAEMLYSESP